MSGKSGFAHNCNEQKVIKNNYKCSLRDSWFSDEECNLIWDFYVAKSFASANGNAVSLDMYGWIKSNDSAEGFPALEKQLADAAGIDEFAIIRCNNLKDTLSNMDFTNDRICVAHPRAALMQQFSVEVDENENVKIKSKENRINAIFRHIRNSLAHGNSFFFDNNMCLFEDYDSKKQTAAILISRNALIEWIRIVDKNSIFYSAEQLKND